MKITTYVLGALLFFACSCKKENESILESQKSKKAPSELVLKEDKSEKAIEADFSTQTNTNIQPQAPETGLLDGFTKYTIPAGEQNSLQSSLKTVSNDSLVFLVYFDSSAIYTTSNPQNQGDINKLWGFSDCTSTQHQNSVRVGWRYFKGNLELLAYCYADGVRSHKQLGTIKPFGVYTCKIVSKASQYIFYLDNKPPVIMDRGCSQGLKFRLFPYFGGDELAPQEVNIWIKELN